jgi:hypothetical protein
MARKATRKTRRRSVKGGGLGATSATWPPADSAFTRNVASPVNTDNMKSGGKRRKTKRSLKRK